MNFMKIYLCILFCERLRFGTSIFQFLWFFSICQLILWFIFIHALLFVFREKGGSPVISRWKQIPQVSILCCKLIYYFLWLFFMKMSIRKWRYYYNSLSKKGTSIIVIYWFALLYTEIRFVCMYLFLSCFFYVYLFIKDPKN